MGGVHVGGQPDFKEARGAIIGLQLPAKVDFARSVGIGSHKPPVHTVGEIVAGGHDQIGVRLHRLPLCDQRLDPPLKARSAVMAVRAPTVGKVHGSGQFGQAVMRGNRAGAVKDVLNRAEHHHLFAEPRGIPRDGVGQLHSDDHGVIGQSVRASARVVSGGQPKDMCAMGDRVFHHCAQFGQGAINGARCAVGCAFMCAMGGAEGINFGVKDFAPKGHRRYVRRAGGLHPTGRNAAFAVLVQKGGVQKRQAIVHDADDHAGGRGWWGPAVKRGVWLIGLGPCRGCDRHVQAKARLPHPLQHARQLYVLAFDLLHFAIGVEHRKGRDGGIGCPHRGHADL